MAEWVKFDGSEKQLSLMIEAKDGYLLKLKDCSRKEIHLNQVNPLNTVHEYTIDSFLICERNPHAEMIIEWARTGRPVFRKYQDGIWRIDPDPIWDKHEKYEFEQPKEKFRYKAALMRGGEYYITVAYTDEGVAGIQRYSSFVRWLHEDWQEVEA